MGIDMTITEIVSSSTEIRNYRKQAFAGQNTWRDYPTYRGIHEYEKRLPKFEDQTVLEHINDRTQQGADHLNVLDIGCGQGIFLNELVENCSEEGHCQIHTYGISSFDYRSCPTSRRKYMDYRVGDAQKLRQIFPDVKFDFIVSLHAFEYFADPLTVLKQAYSVCNSGGIIFLDRLVVLLYKEQAELLDRFWTQQGIRADFNRWEPIDYEPSQYSVAIQKGQNPRLVLPFRYDLLTPNLDTFRIPFQYSFDEKLAN